MNRIENILDTLFTCFYHLTDADKRGYWEYYDKILEKGLVDKGGLIIADNVLWRGQVTAEQQLQGSPEPPKIAKQAEILHGMKA